MKFTYSVALPSEPPKNTYRIKIAYEHGDADLETDAEMTLSDDQATEEFLAKYIDRFKVLATAIENKRSHRIDLPENFRDLQVIDGVVSIDLEYDKIYLGARDIYASMHIHSIEFYNKHGVQYHVEYED